MYSLCWFCFNKSYPIDSSHEKRGRALIVTMTADREGWKADVRKLQKLFVSLGIDTQHMFDPDSNVSFTFYF